MWLVLDEVGGGGRGWVVESLDFEVLWVNWRWVWVEIGRDAAAFFSDLNFRSFLMHLHGQKYLLLHLSSVYLPFVEWYSKFSDMITICVFLLLFLVYGN